MWAGLFVWIDLRQWLLTQDWDGELELWQKVLNEGRINLTRGAACAATEPGWFRMCIAHIDNDTLDCVMTRLATLLNTDK